MQSINRTLDRQKSDRTGSPYSLIRMFDYALLFSNNFLQNELMMKHSPLGLVHVRLVDQARAIRVYLLQFHGSTNVMI